MLKIHRFTIAGMIICSCAIAYAENQVPARYTVCSLKGCPTLSPMLLPHETFQEDQAIVFETSPNSFMVRYSVSFAADANNGWQKIFIDEDTFKDNLPVIGFGGSFTDSAAIIYQNLPAKLKEKIMNLYYSREGLSYSLGRVPMASSDFSCRIVVGGKPVPGLEPCSTEHSPYTYLDQPNAAWHNFSLQAEDYYFKIPMVKDALKIVEKNKDNLKLFASPWSAPAWMKTNGKMVHGSLLPEYQQSWTEYILNFLRAYKANHITFWGITVQNEPEERSDMGERFQNWQTMYFTPEEEANFVANYLGPSIQQFAKEYGNKIHLIVHDDQITSIEKKAAIMRDPNVKQYISGMGLHWYTNTDMFYAKLDNAFFNLNTRTDKPSHFILATEACEGYLPWAKGPSLGNWSRGESYAHDIINDLNHHVSGWTDWNLLLDKDGGPNWAKNHVDSPMLVNLAKQEVYIQPMYYYLGHFSRFIRPNSKMLAGNSQGFFPLEVVAFRVPKHYDLPETIVLVVLNRDRFGRTYYIRDISKKKAQYLNLTIPARSIQSIIFKTATTKLQ